MEKEKILKCYECGNDVTKEEHMLVSDIEDWMSEADGYENLNERYADYFTHLQGSEDCFDEHGFVVICAECFGKLLRKLVRR